MPDERITLAQAAEQFDVPVERLRKAAQRGSLTATRVGTGQHAIWMVYPEDVAAYVAAHRPRTGPPRAEEET